MYSWLVPAVNLSAPPHEYYYSRGQIDTAYHQPGRLVHVHAALQEMGYKLG